MHSRPTRRGIAARAAAMLIALLVPAVSASATEPRPGAAMHVKAGSIWFEDAAALEQWQLVRRRGDADALAAYEARILAARQAWQITSPLGVRIIAYDPERRRAEVEMTAPGRLQGTRWLVDPGALMP